MTHRASSHSWGADAGAHLCGIVVEANSGAAQGVWAGRTDQLELLTLAQLQEPDDIGLTLPFLCVYYDRPEIMKYLKGRGLDMSEKCDPMKWGSPLFYAIHMRRYRMIEMLDEMGVGMEMPCDDIGQLPLMHCKILDDKHGADLITGIINRTRKAALLIQKNFLRTKQRRIYLAMKAGMALINRALRGMMGRKRGRARRKKVMEGDDDPDADADD